MRTSNSRTRLKSNPLQDCPPSQDNVASALNVVYGAQSTQEQRDQAENWLMAYRRTDEAWGISVTLMSSPNVLFAHFGAHTLHEKIKTQWHILPPPKQQELFKILMHYFQTWGDGPLVLLTRVSLAISQIAVHVIPEHWPSLTDDILKLLDPNSSNGKNMTKAVLTLLQVLPEEVNDSLITTERRTVVLASLQKDSEKLVPILSSLLQPSNNTNDEHVKHSALKCLSNWKIPIMILLKSPLIDYVFECLRKYDSLVPESAEYLLQFLSDDEIHDMDNVRIEILKRFAELEPRLINIVTSGNTAAISAFVQMYAGLGEHTDLLIKEKFYGPRLAMILSRCSSVPIFEVASTAFRFFFDLEAALSDTPENDECRLWFVEPFSELVRVLRNQTIIPVHTNNIANIIEMDQEQRELFYSHRNEAGDTVIYAYHFLKQKCTSILFQLLQESLQPPNGSNSSSNCWNVVEATLYCLMKVMEDIDLQDPVISGVINLFPKFPPHPRLSQTALLLLGELSGWLMHHPEFLTMVLDLIMPSLGYSYLVESASKALSNVSISCRKFLVPHLPKLIQIVTPILSDFSVPISCRCKLMVSLSQVIEQLELSISKPLLLQLTQPIIQRIHHNLSFGQEKGEVVGMIGEDLALFSRACMIVIDSDEELSDADAHDKKSKHKMSNTDNSSNNNFNGHPLLEPVQLLWPLLEKALIFWGNNDTIVENVTGVLKHALYTLNTQYFSPMLPNLISFLCHFYAQNPHEDFLRIFSNMLGVFRTVRKKKARDPIFESRNVLFAEGISKIANVTFGIIVRSGVTRPMIIRAFYDLLCQITRMCPDAFFGESNVTPPSSGPPTPILTQSSLSTSSSSSLSHSSAPSSTSSWWNPQFKSGINFLGLTITLMPKVEDRFSHKALITFIETIISCQHEFSKKIVNMEMVHLIESLLLCVANYRISRQFLPSFAMLLLSLLTHFPNEFRSHIVQLMSVDGFPSPNATKAAKEKFLIDLFDGNSKNFSDKLHSFSIICRGFDVSFGNSSKPFFDAPKNEDDIVI